MGSYKFAIGQVNIIDYLLVICKNNAPTFTEVARQSFPGPQPANRNIEFDNLGDGVYYFDFRESSDGIDLGILMATFTVDVKSQTILLERRFYLTGGTGPHDPAADSNQINDPYLDGKTISGVFKEGFRYLVSPDYTYNEYTLVPGGGVQLTGGKTFAMDEVTAIDISYINSSSGSGSSVSFPQDFILKTADFTFDSSYYNNVVEANKSATILTGTMPALSTIPDGTKFGINTHSGTQRYFTLQLAGGDYCLVGANHRNTVYIGKGEEVVFQKKGLYLRVVSWNGDWRRVGECVSQDTPPLNSFAETGFWALFTDYPRAFYWYVNELDPSVLGTATYPAIPSFSNKTKWIIDSVNARMWVPDTRSLFNSATNGGHAGVFSDQSIQDHRHWTIIDKQVASSQFPHDRGTAVTNVRTPIRYWNKSGGGAEGYELDSNTDEPTIGRSSLPLTPGTDLIPGALIGSSVTKPASVDRNFYRII